MAATPPRFQGTGTPRHALACALTIAAALAACRPDAPTDPSLGEGPLAAKGGGSPGGGGATAVTVTSADPPAAPADTTLDVNVYGAGFSTGARAVWSLGGDTTQVHVLSSKVVSAGRLVARIQIPVGAPVAAYDVVVLLRDGKTGIGAELFQVLEGDPAPEFRLPLDDASLGLRSDRKLVEGDVSPYRSLECGVFARLFVGGSGDARVQTDNRAYTDRKCPHYPRAFAIDYGDGAGPQLAGTVINVLQLHNAAFRIPIGATAKRGLNVADARCQGLRWKADLSDGTQIAGDSVLVTRTNATTWEVRSQPYPDDEAYCVAERRTIHMPVRFTIVSDRPVD